MDEDEADRRSQLVRARRSVSGLLAAVTLAVILTAAPCGAPRGPGEISREPLAVGDRAPTFTLQAADGSDVTLQEATVGRPALFYFSMGPG